MKEVTIEKISKVIKYEAVDGTLFDIKHECEEYDKSAKGVLLGRYKKLVVKSKTEFELFDCGSEDYTIDIVKIKDDTDIDLILQLTLLFNSLLYKDESKFNNISELCYSAKCDYLLIGRGYDDYFWPLDTVTNKLNHIKEALLEHEAI